MTYDEAEELVNDLCDALICYEQASSRQTNKARAIYILAKEKVIKALVDREAIAL